MGKAFFNYFRLGVKKNSSCVWLILDPFEHLDLFGAGLFIFRTLSQLRVRLTTNLSKRRETTDQLSNKEQDSSILLLAYYFYVLSLKFKIIVVLTYTRK
jgi:hypothetical protein